MATFSRWKNALGELCEGGSARSSKTALNSSNRLEEFEDNFLVPIIETYIGISEPCSAIEYLKGNNRLKKWLNKYINTNDSYTAFIGNNGNVNGDNNQLPPVNSYVRRISMSPEKECGFLWTKKKQHARELSNYNVRGNSSDGDFGFILTLNTTQDNIIVDYGILFRIIKQWYKKNSDISERWNSKLSEKKYVRELSGIDRVFGKSKEINDDDSDQELRSLLEHIDNINANELLISKELDIAKCIAVWYNHEGRDITRGDWKIR